MNNKTINFKDRPTPGQQGVIKLIDLDKWAEPASFSVEIVDVYERDVPFDGVWLREWGKPPMVKTATVTLLYEGQEVIRDARWRGLDGYY